MLNEFVVDCLVDNPPEAEEMEAMMTAISSSGSENNSSSTTIDNKNGVPPPRKRPKRLPEQCQHHIIAERQRRQTLSERFIALSVLIPGLKKVTLPFSFHVSSLTRDVSWAGLIFCVLLQLRRSL